MPRNDDGEFELVLGNRQLLSGFFIVVILFGVFFTMGYIVGRHSVPAPPPASPPTASAPAPTTLAESKPATDSRLAPGQAEVVPNKSSEAREPTETKKAPEAAPVKEPDAPKPVETKAAEPPKPTREAAKKAPEPAKPQPPAATSGADKLGPQAGETYLQVAAPKRAAASGVIEALKKKGITAVLGSGPDGDTVRVLVGPFKDTAGAAKMRAELEGAGFKPFLRKY